MLGNGTGMNGPEIEAAVTRRAEDMMGSALRANQDASRAKIDHLFRRSSWGGVKSQDSFRKGQGFASMGVAKCFAQANDELGPEPAALRANKRRGREPKTWERTPVVNHTVALSTIGESTYHFGVTYVGTKQLSPTEAFPVLVGDMDNSGSLNAQIIHQLGPGLRSKMAIQTQQSKFVNWQVDGEYRGADFTAAITLGNPDVLVGSGILVAHYLQSITPCLALGGELVYHRRPGEEGTVMSLAGKYTLNNWLATVTLGQAGMHATYYHKASDQLQVGVEFEASTRMQDTSVSFGYQLDLPKANLLFKGSVDSNWIVGATLEKKLPPLPLTLALGAFLNHRKNKFQCGFGLTIG
ncbi:Mitochondrial import receptor subunit TOM40 like protein [Fukomys damarensis]|uniref:Mitochondrial import receptor subunit TOM40 like protein n=1 Tax=Fukomys damarensis TaxID=885580 RepID=A0A091DSY7_FUKDA|nr:Mitochondrial import receptor subunit TOM40 like protein [Fukomys damarensis]